MITRNTKSRPTNRQRQEAAAKPQGARYPKTYLAPEWIEHIKAMPYDEGNELLAAAAGYGTHEIEPNPDALTPEAMEYFNREIRPELDRQHRRFNEGKRMI